MKQRIYCIKCGNECLEYIDAFCEPCWIELFGSDEERKPKMDFELELGELRPLFGRDKGYKDVSSLNHILYDGEIYSGIYDQSIGGLCWRCITDPTMESIHHYRSDRNNPFMVQVISYKRINEKEVKQKEPMVLTDTINNRFEIKTRHVNYPVTGKCQICKSEIFDKILDNIHTTIDSTGITIKQAHENAKLIAKHLDKTISYRKD